MSSDGCRSLLHPPELPCLLIGCAKLAAPCDTSVGNDAQTANPKPSAGSPQTPQRAPPNPSAAAGTSASRAASAEPSGEPGGFCTCSARASPTAPKAESPRAEQETSSGSASLRLRAAGCWVPGRVGTPRSCCGVSPSFTHKPVPHSLLQGIPVRPSCSVGPWPSGEPVRTRDFVFLFKVTASAHALFLGQQAHGLFPTWQFLEGSHDR